MKRDAAKSGEAAKASTEGNIEERRRHGVCVKHRAKRHHEMKINRRNFSRYGDSLTGRRKAGSALSRQAVVALARVVQALRRWRSGNAGGRAVGGLDAAATAEIFLLMTNRGGGAAGPLYSGSHASTRCGAHLFAARTRDIHLNKQTS